MGKIVEHLKHAVSACRFWFAVGFSSIATLCMSLSTCYAETPAAKMISAPLVSPSAAWNYYGSGATHTNGLAAWGITTAEQALPLPPEMLALARSLGANRLSATQYAQNVRDYIRNNIDVEYRFGLGKGGRGALIDQSGTPFDQAELMVKLLRYGNVAANYQVGTVTLNAQQFGLWSGLVTNLNQAAQTFTVNAKAACQFLADGGIPAIVNGAGDCTTMSGNLASVTMGHIWVSANSQTYDPSMKAYRLTAGIDLPEAMGCGTATSPTCGSEAVTANLTGAIQGVTAGAPYIQGQNSVALITKLSTFAGNLETYIKTNNRAAQLEDIVYSHVLPDNMPVPDAGIVYSAAQYSWAGDIPNQFRSAVRVRVHTSDASFYGDEMSGRRVRMRMYGSWSVEQTSIFPPVCSSCIAGIFILDANHPYAANSGTYGDENVQMSAADTMNVGPPFTIVANWGNTTPSTEKYFAQLEAAFPIGSDVGPCTNNLVANTSYIAATDCANEGQPLMVARILSQGTTSDRITSGVTGTAITRHHDLGIVLSNAQTPNSASIFSIVSSESFNQRDADPAKQLQTFEASSAIHAMLESGVPGQVTDYVGPITTFDISGNRTYQVDASTFSALFSQLPICSATGRARNTSRLASAAAAGQTAIFSICDLETLLFTQNHINYSLNDGLYKGGSAVTLADPSKMAFDTLKQLDYASAKKTFLSTSEAVGAITLKPEPDLVSGTGSFPYSLPFARTYSSQSNTRETLVANSYTSFDPATMTSPDTTSSFVWSYSGADTDTYQRLGGGWTHNYDVAASYSNNGAEAFGSRSALDAAQVIAGTVTLIDVEKSSVFQNHVTGRNVNNWIGNALIYNSVSVNIGGMPASFHRLSDGTFNPAPGKSDKLIQTGERVHNAVGIGWDYKPVSFVYTGVGGDTIDFNWAMVKTYNGPALPVFKANHWTFPDGIVVTFNYAIGEFGYHSPDVDRYYELNTLSYRLTGVSNNLGRALTFTATPVYDMSVFGARASNTIYPNVSEAEQTAGYVITRVTDENGRHADFTRDCATFVCSTFTAADANGLVSKYTYIANTDLPDSVTHIPQSYLLHQWYSPSNGTTPFLKFSFDEVGRLKQDKDRNGHITQHFAGGLGSEKWKWSQVIVPTGDTTTTIFNDKNGDFYIRTPMGRITTKAYDNAGHLLRTVLPEGNAVEQTYDVRGNVLRVCKIGKTRAGLPCDEASTDIVTKTAYMEGATVLNCVNSVTCNKPASETDAMNKVTNYTWDAMTGNLTQILLPADRIGVRPQTDAGYTACLGASLLTSKTEKISSSQSVVTAYSNNASNHCVLQQVVTDSAGANLTTALTFDAVGNLTSVDGPLSGTADTTTYQWDNSRRIKSIVSPDPDATGVMLRKMIKYTYNDDGWVTQTDTGTATGADGAGFTIVTSEVPTFDAMGNKTQSKVVKP